MGDLGLLVLGCGREDLEVGLGLLMLGCGRKDRGCRIFVLR